MQEKNRIKHVKRDPRYNSDVLLQNISLILLRMPSKILRILAAVSTKVQSSVKLTHMLTQGKSTCLHANWVFSQSNSNHHWGNPSSI